MGNIHQLSAISLFPLQSPRSHTLHLNFLTGLDSARVWPHTVSIRSPSIRSAAGHRYRQPGTLLFRRRSLDLFSTSESDAIVHSKPINNDAHAP